MPVCDDDVGTAERRYHGLRFGWGPLHFANAREMWRVHLYSLAGTTNAVERRTDRD